MPTAAKDKSAKNEPEIKFGTDGWRGLMARDFTFDNVRRVAQAVADHMREDLAKNPKTKGVLNHPIWVGYDRRFQSEAFAREITRVLQGNNLKACLLSECLPTPALSFLTKRPSGLGIMVTASHNPPGYNGIKIKMDGRAVTEDVTKGVESWLNKNVPARSPQITQKSVRDSYLKYLRSRIDPSRFAGRLKRPVVLDYMHGSASGLMESLLPAKKLIVIRGSHDPLFGGTNPEPIGTNLQPLSERVLKEKALVGIALDGDGDRIGIVDEKGRYFTPCQVFPMIINYLVGHKKIKGKIIQSVSLGYLSGRMAKALGLAFEELPVGFKYVAEQLASGQALIGGEESGGYAWKGCLPERDGLLTALLFLEMLAILKKTPSQLWDEIETQYGKSFFKRVDHRLHRPIADKNAFAAKIAKRLPKKILGTPIKELIQIDGIKIILEGDHWILLRPSGTEPLMRLYAESDSEKRTGEYLDLAKKWAGPIAA